MATQVQVVEVSSPEEMEASISMWVVQGYVLANKTPVQATMVKKKEFSVLWAVIGFVFCIIPLAIYLIVYAAESDKVVEIRVTRRDSVNIDDLTELEKLNELRERGVLTQDEYDARKQRLLG